MTENADTSIDTGNAKAKWLLFAVLAGIPIIGYLEMNNGLVSNLTARFVGPPQVALQESYSEKPNGPTFDHSPFDGLIKKHVDKDGWVDYQKLKVDTGKLDAYIESLGEANIDTLGRNERLAFLINAYNAFTLKLIMENYPLDSIKEIPTAERWAANRWNLAGQNVSLNQIEHEHIRPNFKEPRIHFALVCAAIGCPPLRNEAYTGRELERQLSEQTKYVHQKTTWLRYEKGANKLGLTQLYRWYGDDFVQVAGTAQKFAANYSAELKTDLEQGTEPSIEWLDYDWTLNDTTKKSSR